MVDIALNAEDPVVHKIYIQEIYSKSESIRVACWGMSTVLLEKGDVLFSE